MTENNEQLPIIEIHDHLSVYGNNYVEEIVEPFMNIDKKTFNNIDLNNLSCTSDDNFIKIIELFKQIAEINPQRFRNINLYTNKLSIDNISKDYNRKRIIELLSVIDEFQFKVLLLYEFEIDLNMFIKIINVGKLCIMFYAGNIMIPDFDEFWDQNKHKSL